MANKDLGLESGPKSSVPWPPGGTCLPGGLGPSAGTPHRGGPCADGGDAGTVQQCPGGGAAAGGGEEGHRGDGGPPSKAPSSVPASDSVQVTGVQLAWAGGLTVGWWEMILPVCVVRVPLGNANRIL